MSLLLLRTYHLNMNLDQQPATVLFLELGQKRSSLLGKIYDFLVRFGFSLVLFLAAL
jgi:hypothetical protein